MNYERLKRYTCLAVIGIIILFSGFLFFKYIIGIILPFLIAWGIALLTRAPSAYISSRTRLSERGVRLCLAVLYLLVALFVISLGVYRLSRELMRFFAGLGEGGALRDILERIFSAQHFLDGISPYILEKIGGALYELLSSAISAALRVVSSAASHVPRIILSVLITLIGTAYFAFDLDRIHASLLGLLPKGARVKLSRFKERFVGVLIKYIKAYFYLMLITFVLMLLGLSLIGAPYALLISVIIAALDVLPLIGVGTVLVPWSIFAFIMSEVKLGVGLLVLYLVSTVIRQIIEPKIIGKNLGIHPLAALFVLYFSYSLFGLFGLLLVPVFSLALNLVCARDLSEPEKEE